MSRLENTLVIRTRGLDVELDGDAAAVRRAYRALRAQLVEHYFDTMAAQRPASRAPAPPVRGLGEASRPRDDSAEEHFINLVVCEDIYHKMYLVDEFRFAKGFLSRALRGSELRRIYVHADVEDRVRERLDVGKTLWRELTAAGKAAVGRSD